MDIHPQNIIATIARCMFITPLEHIHTGYDWPTKQREWEALSKEQKQIWYDKALIWLNNLKEKMPDAYEFYMSYRIPDLGDRNHLFSN